MPTLPLLVCAVLAASPDTGVPSAARTPPAKEPAARLVVLKGKVSGKTSAGATFAVAVGTDFDPGDTITVAPGAWAALALKNQHVVRLDDDLELRISELALFNAPANALGVGEQLNRLLTPEERKDVRAERLIGWHADLMAANTPGRAREEPAPKAQPAPGSPPASAPSVAAVAKSAMGGGTIGAGKGGGGVGNGAGYGAGAPSRGGGAAAAPAAEPAANSVAERPRRPALKDIDDEQSEPRAPAPPPPPPAPSADAKKTREVTKPALTLEADEGLTACLVNDLRQRYPEYASTVTELVLEVSAKANAEPRVRLKGGLSAPPCAQDWVKARQQLLGKSDAPRSIVVPLTK